MSGLRARLLGDLALEWNGRPIQCSSAKAMELLCVLLVNRDRAHSRDRLASTLWPDESDGTARRYLRQALWKLKTAIEAAGPAPGPAATGATGRELIATRVPGWLRVDAGALEWTDVGVLESARASLGDLPGQQLSTAQAAELGGAIDVYRGEFLSGWEQSWCGDERSRLHEHYLSMLEQMAGHCEAQRRYTDGIGYGQRVLRHDPARESTHYQLMSLHHRAGDRTAAVRQFQLCTSALADTFGIRPSAATVALHEHICADRVIDIPLQATSGRSAADDSSWRTRPGLGTAAVPAVILAQDPDLLATIQTRLDDLQTALTALHQLVRREALADPPQTDRGFGGRAS